MKILKVIFLLSMLFFSYSIGQENETDTHGQAVIQLLELMNMKENLSKNIDAALDLQLKQNPSMKDYKEVFLAFFNKYMSWDSLKDDFVTLYKSVYTEKEVIDLINFYKTDTGKKVAKNMAVLLKKGGELAHKKIQEHIYELQEMIREKKAVIQGKQ